MKTPKKILLTGCSRGLGRALLAEFDAAGHTVAGCSRSSEYMQQLKSECSDRHFFQSLDVSDDAAVGEWVKAAIPLSPGVIDTDMLREAWGEDAGGFHSATEWAVQAAPFILALNASHNGQSLTTPA